MWMSRYHERYHRQYLLSMATGFFNRHILDKTFVQWKALVEYRIKYKDIKGTLFYNYDSFDDNIEVSFLEYANQVLLRKVYNNWIALTRKGRRLNRMAEYKYHSLIGNRCLRAWIQCKHSSIINTH